jgi:hypothetical protein
MRYCQPACIRFTPYGIWLLKDSLLVKQIESNTVTAELIEQLVLGAKLNFKKKWHYYILLKGDVEAVRLVNRPAAKDYGTGMGFEQYLFLNDPSNHLEFVKIIKDPF